jgi:hypothetical protein
MVCPNFLSYALNLDPRLLSPKRHPINDGDTEAAASSSVPLRRVVGLLPLNAEAANVNHSTYSF